MAGSKPKKNKTKDRMRRQTDDLVTLSALANGEKGNKTKETIGTLNKWLETVRDGFTGVTPEKNDVPYNNQIPKFSIKVIAGANVEDTTKKTNKKK